MNCVYAMPKGAGSHCGNVPVDGSDFCSVHIESTQNACTAVRCGKMRQAGSKMCSHHALLATVKREKKTTAERLGGYSQ
jgi:hypothetical protein